MKQSTLFEEESPLPTEGQQDWGTFKDSLRAPIHNWFTYPAGFSYKAVESSFLRQGIGQGCTIYDPFMGSGTTNLVAKKLAINSYGVEAHPFVYRIACTKMNWEIASKKAQTYLKQIESHVQENENIAPSLIQDKLEEVFPELVLKCYEPKTLYHLLLVREGIEICELSEAYKNFFFVGLTSLLRQVSSAATGWPYIAPDKKKTSSIDKEVIPEFQSQIHKMLNDVHTTRQTAHQNYLDSQHHLFNGDSRQTQTLIPSNSIDYVFTSPPYLNNFDYADRTRLELYFWGEAKSWNDITQNVRTKLITSATTQISRDDPRYLISEELRNACPEVATFIAESVRQLGELRLTRGGKKSYDHLVSGYFNDLFQILREVYRVLKPNTKALFVLGDSAPYGVHIPTDELIGKIGVCIGFTDYQISVLRERGGKWKDNPQRHDVALRESIVTLSKR